MMQAPLDENERVDRIAAHIKEIISLLGEDPGREGLLKTPRRAAKALVHACSGYSANPEELLGNALFQAESSGMVIVGDIEFYSMCEHHILPFFGQVSVGYMPGEKIVGLSKIARMVDAFSHRLQLQERFTSQLAECLRTAIGAKGVIVACCGEHLCMKMRGVEKQHASTTTVAYNGLFTNAHELRREFFEAIGRR